MPVTRSTIPRMLQSVNWLGALGSETFTVGKIVVQWGLAYRLDSAALASGVGLTSLTRAKARL
jgi:hypothetical protein